MIFPELIETKRLQLRWPVKSDADEIFARYAQDLEVARYLTWQPHHSIQQTIDFLEREIVNRLEGQTYPWLIQEQETRLVLGMVSLRIEKHIAHLGYCLARDAWGRGYATEAAQAVVAVGKQVESLWRIEAYCDVENTASFRVLEKTGLTFEGTQRRQIVLPNLGEVPRDVHCCAVVRDEEGNWP